MPGKDQERTSTHVDSSLCGACSDIHLPAPIWCIQDIPEIGWPVSLPEDGLEVIHVAGSRFKCLPTYSIKGDPERSTSACLHHQL